MNQMGMAEFSMRHYRVDRIRFFEIGKLMRDSFGEAGFTGVSKTYATFKNKSQEVFMINDKGQEFGNFRLKPNSRQIELE